MVLLWRKQKNRLHHFSYSTTAESETSELFFDFDFYFSTSGVTMKTSLSARLITVFSLFFFFGISGCLNYMVPGPGATAAPEFRMPLPESGSGRSVWKGKHLDIVYTLDSQGGQTKISGEISIHEGILLSFSKLARLRVKAHLLDDHGGVLASVGITPLYSTYSEVDGPMGFRANAVIPTGTVAVTFSYSGLLVGQFNEPSEGWDIDFTPF
jgi:hypothetical protein